MEQQKYEEMCRFIGFHKEYSYSELPAQTFDNFTKYFRPKLMELGLENIELIPPHDLRLKDTPNYRSFWIVWIKLVGGLIRGEGKEPAEAAFKAFYQIYKEYGNEK